MTQKNIIRYIIGTLIFIALAVGIINFFSRKNVAFEINKNTLNNPTSENKTNEVKNDESMANNEQTQTKEKKKYRELKYAIDTNDFKTVGKILGAIYENGWIKSKEFNDLERDAYIKVDKDYFTVGNFDKSLEVTDLIYKQAPLSERFRYLLILSLEALGKKAFAEKDYDKAEEYATKILQIMYRTEGVNLLADIYIEKIKVKIKTGNHEGALSDWNYIMIFELTVERKKTLNALRDKIYAK